MLTIESISNVFPLAIAPFLGIPSLLCLGMLCLNIYLVLYHVQCTGATNRHWRKIVRLEAVWWTLYQRDCVRLQPGQHIYSICNLITTIGDWAEKRVDQPERQSLQNICRHITAVDELLSELPPEDDPTPWAWRTAFGSRSMSQELERISSTTSFDSTPAPDCIVQNLSVFPMGLRLRRRPRPRRALAHPNSSKPEQLSTQAHNDQGIEPVGPLLLTDLNDEKAKAVDPVDLEKPDSISIVIDTNRLVDQMDSADQDKTVDVPVISQQTDDEEDTKKCRALQEELLKHMDDFCCRLQSHLGSRRHLTI